MSKKENLKLVMEMFMEIVGDSTSNDSRVKTEKTPPIETPVLGAGSYMGFEPLKQGIDLSVDRNGMPHRKVTMDDIRDNSEHIINIMDRVEALDEANNIPYSHSHRIKELEKENQKLTDELTNKASFDKYYDAVKKNEELRRDIQLKKQNKHNIHEVNGITTSDMFEQMKKENLELRKKMLREKYVNQPNSLESMLSMTRDNKTPTPEDVLNNTTKTGEVVNSYVPPVSRRKRPSKKPHSYLVSKALKSIKK
jgi:ribosomal protein L20